jgi:DNA-binding NarL/FixJ family response regulator
MAEVLLLNGQSGRYWIDLLQRAVRNLGGTLIVLDWRDARPEAWAGHDLIILDASVVGDLASTIRTIRAFDPLVRIVVVSPTPHWKQARETLVAGGTDYVKKAEDETELVGILRESLARAPSARWISQAGS